MMGMEQGDIDDGRRKGHVDRKALAMLERARYPCGWRRLAIYIQTHIMI